MIVWHWFSTAVSTYVLHPLHGNGYQYHSGIGSTYTPKDAVYLFAIYKLARHRNCHHKRCPRFGHPHPKHGWPACKHHWNEVPEHLAIIGSNGRA